MKLRKYFAYGSNMSAEQMRVRCPDSFCIGMGKLRDYKFSINSRGVATIVRKKNENVYGIVWDISEEDEKRLDNYEGVSKGIYNKKIVEIETANQVKYDALVYIANDAIVGYPRENYIELIIISAENYCLPKNYIKRLKSWKKGS